MRNSGYPFRPLRLASASHLPLAGEDRKVQVLIDAGTTRTRNHKTCRQPRYCGSRRA